MGAVQAMTGGGGWPMSVFLTPDGRPFYGGTYFPDEPRHGMPSFRQVLEGVDRAWREQRAEVEAAGRAARRGARRAAGDRGRPPTAPTPALFEAVADGARWRAFDARNGGWGGAPKFPQPMTIEFLLRRIGRRRRDGPVPWPGARSRRWPTAASTTSSAAGSIATRPTPAGWCRTSSRCSTTTRSSRGSTCTPGRSTGDARYRDGRRRRRSTTCSASSRLADGAFAASQDADTDGVEGLTFTWTRGRDPRRPRRRGGAVRGRVRRHRRGQLGGPHDPVAGLAGRPHAAAVARGRRPSRPRLADARARLLARRASGPSRRATTRCSRPGTGWRSRRSPTRGGSSASRATSPPRPRAAAEAIIGRTARPRTAPCGRSWKDGRATGQGVLEDYADLADGLLALYEATFDERWFATARALMDRVLARFADPAGGFFDTADDHERLVTRPKDVQDNAVPSGNAMAALVLLRLAAWTGEARYRDAAERAFRTVTAVRRALSDRVRPVAGGAGPRPRAGRRGRDRRRPGRRGDPGAPRRDDPRLPPAPGRGRQRDPRGVGDPVARRPDRRSTDDRPRTSVAGSSAACRSPIRPRSAPSWRPPARPDAQGPLTTMVVPVESPSGSWFIDDR